MKRRYYIIPSIVVLIIINLPVVNTVILREIDGNHFKYSNANATFTYTQTLDILQPFVSEYTVERFIREGRPGPENNEVYRIYRINPLCFWRWRYYLGVSKNFSYKSWKEIEPNRVSKIPGNMWQSF